MPETRYVRIWDGATRLFHWLLVLLLGFSWLSVRKGWMEWHIYSGLGVGALLLFRLAWGFVGSETARFSRMLASPFVVIAQLLRFHRRTKDTQVGHNAAGGWMAIFMLLLVAAQVITGLGASDELVVEGPLAKYLGTAMSDLFTRWHYRLFTVLKIVVVMHLLAIAAYFIIKRHNLLFPMLHGYKRLPVDIPAPRMVHPARAWVLLLAAASIMYYVATQL